jgi:hypothetical protein
VQVFHKGWHVDGSSAEAAGQCVATVTEMIRAGCQPSESVGYPDPEDLSFSVVFCSIDDVKCRNTISLYERLLANVDHELIVIRDARSLAEAYNRAMAKARGDIVILSHDDIDVLSTDFAGRLADCFGAVDIVGIIGGAKLAGPRWSSCNHPYLSGWVTHCEYPGADFQVDLVSPGPRRTDLRLLDGVFIAARREVFSSVRFDESTFDGFHLYDLDWTCRAAEAGFRIGTAGDLLVVHQSRGRFGSEWQRYADRFCDKHSIRYVPPREPVKIYEATLDSENQVRRFYAQMMALDRAAR